MRLESSKYFRMKVIVLILLSCFSVLSIGQKHAMNWYFGTKAGISFKTYPPSPLSNGSIIQREGNATISDENGNLLFYTDGSIVWNKNHKKMKNGTGLLGQHIAAQSCIIAQQPKNRQIYYIFTISDWENNSGSLSYSIVDVSLDNGLGAVTEKNILINSKCREQISAVYANENGDVWILSHEKNTNNFVNYKLTESGLETDPVRSIVGTEFNGKNRYGQLKFSADGTKVCSTLGGSSINTVQLFDFDINTGKLSNPMIIVDSGVLHAYSSEFSPNGKVLYVTAFNQPDLFQFDLSSNNEKIIQSSKINLSTNNKTKSCLQIGYDHKIYVSKNKQSELGVINEPNKIGKQCDYNDAGITFAAGSECRLGFPNFIQSYFKTYLPLVDNTSTDTSSTTSDLQNILSEKTFVIHFKTSSYTIDADNAQILDQVVNELRLNSDYRVVISSHTDCTGSASMNLNLSQKRADSSAEYLNNKLGAKNNKGIGYGENQPLINCKCSDCEASDHAKNRRTEIKLIPVK